MSRVRNILVAGAAVAELTITASPVMAHHSMALYEFMATTLEGTVQEFKYTNPHSVIVLKVNAANGGSAVWYLEGDPPATLDRDGISRTAFHAGDRLKLLVHRLKSGQSGGLWSIRTVLEQNGHEFAGHQCVNSADRCNPD